MYTYYLLSLSGGLVDGVAVVVGGTVDASIVAGATVVEQQCFDRYNSSFLYILSRN